MSELYIITGMRRRICGRYILIGILGIVICLGLIPCRTTLAAGSLYDNANQDDYLLELSPVSRRMSFKPGEQKKENLQIKNTGRKAVYVDVYAEAYVPEDEIAGQNEGLADTYTQLSQWVKFKDDNGEYHHILSFTLYPNQIRDVRYSVDVPKETVGGGQYAIIFAEFTPTKTDDESTFKARSRMGMSLFASVDDSGVVRDAQINNIKINGVLVNRNITIDYTVKNSGNIDFQSSNEMTVESIFGKELYHDIFVKTILPESSKAISDECKAIDTRCSPLAARRYKLQATS